MYLVVGFLSAAIDVGGFQVLYSLGLAIPLANAISLILSTVFNFSLNRNVTFKSVSNPVRSMVLYFILFAFNYCFSSIFISVLVGWEIYSILAKVLALAITTTWNFALYRLVVFK